MILDKRSQSKSKVHVRARGFTCCSLLRILCREIGRCGILRGFYISLRKGGPQTDRERDLLKQLEYEPYIELEPHLVSRAVEISKTDSHGAGCCEIGARACPS